MPLGWGRVFAIASALTPVFLGVCLGALASGAIPRAGKTGFHAAFIATWLTLFCFGVGTLALTLFAFLAAVYLTVEAREIALQEDFRGRLSPPLSSWPRAAPWPSRCRARRSSAAVSARPPGRCRSTSPPGWRQWPPSARRALDPARSRRARGRRHPGLADPVGLGLAQYPIRRAARSPLPRQRPRRSP
jgi:hypothetical protein